MWNSWILLAVAGLLKTPSRRTYGYVILSPSYTFMILATVELRLTPIYQVVMHQHES